MLFKVFVSIQLTKYDQNRAIGDKQWFKAQHQTVDHDDC